MTQKLRIVPDPETPAVDALSDDDLMRLAALDRRDAFEALVVRHQRLVFGLATRFLGSREQGRDVTQDVFLSLWAERRKYRPEGRFRSYLTSVCLNRCRVIARRPEHRSWDNDDVLQATAAMPDTAGKEIPLESLLREEQQKAVQRYLTTLPENCREVMIYRFTHEMPLGEIADMTGMPVGTVKSHILRGLGRIRKMMKRGR